MALRVFLLDDHEVVRRGLRDLLETEADIEVCGEAGEAAGAVEAILSCDPDVAVLDVQLPDGDGIAVCRELRSQRPDLGCLVLTSFSDDEAMLAAVMAGASGYVLKQIKGNELISDIRRVAAGESLIEPAALVRVSARLRAETAENRRLAQLTGQERKVLDLVAEGLTNRQIAEQLFLAEKTVKNYVSNLLMKMGFARRTEAAVWATRIADRNNTR